MVRSASDRKGLGEAALPRTDCATGRAKRFRDARRLRVSLEALERRDMLAASLNWFESFDHVPRVAWHELGDERPAVESPNIIGPRERVSAEWLVQLSDRAASSVQSLPSITDLLDESAVEFQVIAGLGNRGGVLVRSLSVEVEDARRSLTRNSSVSDFHANRLIEGQSTMPNESDFAGGLLGGLDAIDALSAWGVSRGSSGIVVAVLDTGLDATHPDLYLNVWLNQGEIPAAMKDGEGIDLVDLDGDGLITFYDLNNVSVSQSAPYELNFGGWQSGPNATFLSDENANGYIDAQDLLASTNWADGRDNDENGFFDDLFGVNFRAGSTDPLAPNDPSDTLGHGTHVAGTIGAVGNNGEGVVGVNWRTSLMSLRILDNNNRGDTGAALRAVNYAAMMQRELDSVEGRVVRGADVRVLNNSWGQPGGYEPSLERAIRDGAEEGILFVAAAGNGNILGQGVDNDRTPFYPASYDAPNVIAVTASNPNDALASFANFGAESVDIAAPGVAIRSTLPGGRYGAANGTSMAAPHVAGTAALIWSANPQATMEEVSEAILTTTKPIQTGSAILATGGMLDLGRAITSDVFAPSARVIDAPTVRELGGATAELTVEYRHRDGIDPATLGDDDLTVIRTWGSNDKLVATLQPGSVLVSGDTITATYTVVAPGGDWDALDFGRYRVETNLGGVQSVEGTPTESRDIGFFRVQIDDPSVLYVDRFDDSTERGSLRHAINTANAAGAPRTIILDSGTYTVGIAPVPDPAASFYFPPAFCASWDHDGLRWTSGDTGDYVVTGDITIAGNSMDETVIDGSGLDRVFRVSEGGSLELNRLAVTGGLSAADQGGGGILSAGRLTLRDTLVRENTAVSGRQADPIRGGGVAIWSGSADIQRSWIHRNEADYGGGIFFCDSASGQVSQSTLEANVGGGLHSHSDSNIEVVNSTFSANQSGLGATFHGKQDDRLSRDIDSGIGASVSEDGRFTTFPVSHFGTTLIALQDRLTGYVEYISISTAGDVANADSFLPRISASGRHVVFESDANNLVPGDTNDARDIFIHDRQTNETVLLSRGADGTVADGNSSDARLSADGRHVVFVSVATNLVAGDTNGVADVFVLDRNTGSVERVSVSSGGAEADADSRDPSISDDGRFVAFASLAGTLDVDDTNKREDAFIFDRVQQTIRRIEVGPSAKQSGDDELLPMISGDASTLVFQSLSDTLLPIDLRIQRAGGAAAQFDGVDDRILVEDNSALRAAQFSIEIVAWIDSTKSDGRDVLISKTTDGTWRDGYGLFYDQGQIHFFVSGQANVVSAPVRLDRTHHFVGTYDGSSIRLYVDGTEEASVDLSGPPLHSTQPLIIGGAAEATGFFGGALDEVAIYDFALSGGDILEHAALVPFEYNGAVESSFEPFEPVNHDDFVNRRRLGSVGLAEDEFNNNFASSEYGEPAQSGSVNSVWWSWTAPFDGMLDVSTIPPSSFYVERDGPTDTFLTIAEGDSLENLIVLSQADEGGEERGHARTSATVERGKEYAIIVDGYESIQGRAELGVRFDAVNMDPANRIDLGSATRVATQGFARGTSSFSPNSGSRLYSHWSWTAPGDGILVADIDDTSSLQIRVGTGDGDFVEGAQFNTAFPNSVSLPVVAGQQYFIETGSRGPGQLFELTLDFFDASNDQQNDMFDSAADLGSVTSASVRAVNAGYTGEVDELSQSDELHSAWWTWTAPSEGIVVVDTEGSRFDTHLVIAQGDSVDGLVVVAEDDQRRPYGGSPNYTEFYPDRLAFSVQAGEVYRIAVDGQDDQQGLVQLNLHLLPNNDHFDDRIHLGSEAFVDVAGTNLGFSAETSEPAQDGEVNSSWWSWTAPSNGLLSVDMEFSEINSYTSIFTGDALEDLTTVFQRQTTSGRRFTVPVESGVVYHIAVDGFRFPTSSFHNDQGTFRMLLQFEEQPTPLANDLFDDRIDLGSVVSAMVSSNNEGFTNDYASRDASAWWSWTAPADGSVRLSTDTFDYRVAILSGDDPTTLVSLDSASRSRPLEHPVTAGTQYSIEVFVDSFSSPDTFDFEFALQFVPQGTNDDFADRIDLGLATEITVRGNNTGFTAEPGEATYSGEVNSSWYSWTAPADGTLHLHGKVPREATDYYFGVGFASSAENFSVQAETLAPPGFRRLPATLAMPVFEGNTYTIVFDGREGRVGSYEFDLQLFAYNDFFSDRIDLGSAAQIRTTGYNWEGYTGELGEPTQSGGTQSAWWEWTAPASGALEVTASYDPVTTDGDGTFFLTVATGTQVFDLDVLGQQEAPRFGGDLDGRVSVSTAVNAGETYLISVDMVDQFLTAYEQYPVILDLGFTPEMDNGPGSNNGFDQRVDLGSNTFTEFSGNTIGFTSEPGEIAQDGVVNSAWYSWTAPADGRVTLTNRGDSPMSVTFAIGNTVDQVSVVGAHLVESTARQPVVAGQTYQIAVDGAGHLVGPFEFWLSLDIGSGIVNDLFADRVDLGSLRNVDIFASNRDFTSEVGERGRTNQIQSAWYSWTAPADGIFKVEVPGSFSFDPVISVWTGGGSVDSLTELAWNDDFGQSRESYSDAVSGAAVQLSVQRGVTYHISVDGFDGSSGFSFEVNFDEGLGGRISEQRPVGHWRFDSSMTDVVSDDSGNESNGLVQGGTASQVPGLVPTSAATVVNKVFIYDAQTGLVTYADTEREGLSGLPDISGPAISRDGRYLAVSTDASKQSTQVWLIDLLEDVATELPFASDRMRQVTGDGRFVVYDIDASSALGDAGAESETPLLLAQTPTISTLDIKRSTIAHTRDAQVAVAGTTQLSDVLLSENRAVRDIDFVRATADNSVFSIDPGANLIGALVRYGIAPPVHPILRGNPALDAGDVALDIPVDQRGEPRESPDIGAYEATSGAVTGRLFLDVNGNQTFDRTEVGLVGPQIVASRGGVTVSVDTQSDDPLTPNVDETGQFLLGDLAAGDQLIGVQGFPGWRVSTPDVITFPQQALEPNDDILNARVSRDGRFVAFETRSTNLVPSDTTDDLDVYLFDVESRSTELVTNIEHAVLMDISDDGQTILYGQTLGTTPWRPLSSLVRILAYDRVADQHITLYDWPAGAGFPGRLELSSDGRYAFYDTELSLPYIHEIRTGNRFRFSDIVTQSGWNWLVGYLPVGPELIYHSRFLNAEQETISGLFSYNLETGTHGTLYSEVVDNDGYVVFHSTTSDGAFIRFWPSSSFAGLGSSSRLDRSTPLLVLDRSTGEVSPDALVGGVGNAPAFSSDLRFVAGETSDANLNHPPAFEVRDRSTGETRVIDVPSEAVPRFVDFPITMTADGRFLSVARFLFANPFESLIGVSIDDGDLVSGFDIGLVPDPGILSGTVFEDIAPNSRRDDGEPAIEGWRVFLDLNQNGLLDVGERFETTDAEGRYQFADVDSFQEHTIRLEVREGFAQASPDPRSGLAWNIFLPAGGEISDRDFAVRRVVNTPQSTNSSVAGRIFDDVNGNETFDPGVDRPHEDVRIYLDANNDRQHNPGTNEPITRTDAEGRYLFAGLGSRIVSVSTILDGGTVHASPLGNSYSQETYPLFPGLQPFGNPQAIDIGDFNGDGHGDVAVLLGERNEIAIRLNNGQGGFDAGGFEIDLGAAGSGPVAMIIGQLNEAGTRPDIVVASQFSSNAVILLDVDAVAETVGAQTTVPVGDEPTDVTAADVTADGRLDLIVANKGFPGDGSISVLVNQGDGSFAADAPISTGGKFAVSVVAGEFTGDAHLDLAVAHASPSLPTSPHGDVRILAGDGLGGFIYDGNRYEVGALPTDLLTSDFNGDGLADLAVANFASNTISLLSGGFESGDSGPTVFRSENAILGTASGAIDIALGDMDGDGDIDILASNLTDRNISIFRNVSTPGQSRFEPLENIGLGQFSFAQRMPLVTANIDGDLGGVGGQGTPDIITVPRLTDTIHVLTNKLIDGSHRVRLDGQNDVVGLDFLTRAAVVPPTLDAIPEPPAIDEDDDAIEIVLRGISKGRVDGPDLQITANSSDPVVIPHPVIDYVSGASQGSLSFFPAADANTTVVPVTVTVEARNAGANGVFGDEDDGIVRQSFTVTVNGVNDAPEFDLQPLVSVTQKAGSVNVDGLVSRVSPGGGSDEAGQTLGSFVVTAGDPTLFSVLPSIDSQGRLSFTPDANKSGVTLVSVSLSDDGGVQRGGADTATKSFVINITAVNDAPSITLGGDLLVSPGAGPQSEAGFAGAFHPGAGDDDASQVIADFLVTADRDDLFADLPDIADDGTLTFAPSGVTGSATVTVQVRDNGGTADGGVDLSAPQTFTITVADAPEVESVLINDGSAGRSQVTSLTVTFSGEVDHALLGDAFRLTNIDTNEEVGTIDVAVSDVGGKTSAILTFSGASTVARGAGNSLANGNYRLDVESEKVTTPGGVLSMADDYQFGGQTRSDAGNDDFFRMFGDVDGDGDVDGLDYAALGTTFLRQSGDASFDGALDNDGDGDVDGTDYAAFGEQFLRQRR